jgi:NAD-dependent DNA ligase
MASRSNRKPNLSLRTFLDAQGQPDARFNAQKRIDRGVSELLGLARGVLADGVVTEAEAHALRNWLHANPDLAGVWPVSALGARLEQIFEDGIVDADEREDLAGLLMQMVGGEETSSFGITLGHSGATTLPLDAPPPALEFNGCVYVFTGKFAYGPRKVCEQTVVELGGECTPKITLDTNVLVIGTFGSRDWVQSSYGRKIEKAVQYRQQGMPISIVTEDHWVAALP